MIDLEKMSEAFDNLNSELKEVHSLFRKVCQEKELEIADLKDEMTELKDEIYELNKELECRTD